MLWFGAGAYPRRARDKRLSQSLLLVSRSGRNHRFLLVSWVPHEFTKLDFHYAEDKLVLNQLPGEGGRCFFESTDYAGRMRLSEILGAIVGVIHRQKPKRADILRDNCLSRWREAAEKAIKNDETLRQAIGCIDSGFYPEFDSLMVSIAIAPTDEAPILLWRDAVFHNLLVNPARGNVEVTGTM